jgi:sulfur-oxidizing protein SoxZ
MEQPMRIRTRREPGRTLVQILMPHPMETGLRVDESGHRVPAHHITDIEVTLSGRLVFAARMGIAVSRDPLLSFRVTGAQAGALLRVTWTDNLGRSRSDQATVT